MNKSDLFAIGMESDTAYRLMQELCELLDIPYPPEPTDTTEIKKETI